MYSEEMQLRGLLEDGVLPSMKLSDDAIGKVEDPLVKQIMETMRQTGGAFSHFDSTVSSDVYKESEAQIQKLIAGQATAAQVTEALQEVQQEANAKS